MTTRNLKPRAYVLGLAIGTFWLIAASAGFSIQALASAGTRNTQIALVAVLAIALVLLVVIFSQILVARKLPAEPRTEERRKMGRRFVRIVVLEVAAFMVVNPVAWFTGHVSAMVALNVIVVGVHFLPLATLFGVPRYTILGILFCVVAVLSLLLIPADAQTGAALSRFVIPPLGCAAACWFIAIGSIGELRRLLR